MYIDLAGLLIVVLLWVLFTNVTYVVIAIRMQGERELCVPPSNERVVSQLSVERAFGEARRIRYM